MQTFFNQIVQLLQQPARMCSIYCVHTQWHLHWQPEWCVLVFLREHYHFIYHNHTYVTTMIEPNKKNLPRYCMKFLCSSHACSIKTHSSIYCQIAFIYWGFTYLYGIYGFRSMYLIQIVPFINFVWHACEVYYFELKQ